MEKGEGEDQDGSGWRLLCDSDLDVRGVSWDEAGIWALDRARWRRVVYDKVFVDAERHTTNG